MYLTHVVVGQRNLLCFFKVSKDIVALRVKEETFFFLWKQNPKLRNVELCELVER